MKRFFGNMAIAFLSLILGLFLSELLLRVFAPIPYSQEVAYLPDKNLGFRLKPREVYKLKSGGKCSVNNMGFRGKEDTLINKSASSFRIVVLGGSSTFCYQTDDDGIWTKLLQDRLIRHFGEKFEVINAGVPGYSTVLSKRNYMDNIRKLSPDAVIVYHTWNDMKFFQFIESGREFHATPYRENRLKSFFRNYQLAWRVRNFYHEFILPAKRENYVQSTSMGKVAIPHGGLAHSWMEKHFTELGESIKSAGSLPVFVSQGGLLSEANLNEPQIRSVVYAEYQNMDYDQILKQWFACSEIIRGSAEKVGAPYLDAYSSIPHTLADFSDHVHLTQKGNKALANFIFTSLKESEAFRSRFASVYEKGKQ